jgi:hypothetical protein
MALPHLGAVKKEQESTPALVDVDQCSHREFHASFERYAGSGAVG